MKHITTGGLDLPTKITETESSEPPAESCARHPETGQAISVPAWSPDCKVCEAVAFESQRAGVPSRYTLETFAHWTAEIEEQQAILDIARQFSEDPKAFGTGLILTGRCGTGKTMLACAMLTERIERRVIASQWPNLAVIGSSGRYVNAIDFMRKVKDAWKQTSFDTETSLLHKYASNPLMIIDEVGAQFGTDAERTVFTDLINSRYNQLRPTILVSNLTIREMENLLGDRVIDRFREGGKVLVFDWQSWRGRNNRNSQSSTPEVPHAHGA